MIAMAGLLVALVVVIAYRARPRRAVVNIPRENIEGVELGMAECDVLTTVGAPPGDYRSSKRIGYIFCGSWIRDSDGGPAYDHVLTWETDEWMLEVFFLRDNTVASFRTSGAVRIPTWYERTCYRVKSLLP